MLTVACSVIVRQLNRTHTHSHTHIGAHSARRDRKRCRKFKVFISVSILFGDFYGRRAPPKRQKRNKKMCSNLQCSLCSQFTVTAINLLTTVHPIWCRSLSLLLSAFLFALDALTPLPTLSVTLDLSHSCTLHSALSPACSSIFRQFIRIVKGEQSQSSVGGGQEECRAEQSRVHSAWLILRIQIKIYFDKPCPKLATRCPTYQHQTWANLRNCKRTKGTRADTLGVVRLKRP